MYTKTLACVVALAGCLLALQAHAVPVLVDFTSGTWSSADGAASASRDYSGIAVALSPTGGLLSLGASDGIGIGDAEIGSGESLDVMFSSPVTVLSIHLRNLLLGPGPGASTQERFAADFGGTSYNGGGTVSGLFDQPVNLAGVSAISFRAIGRPGNDFSLAGIWIDDGLAARALLAQVPEPGPLPLLAAGILLFAIWTKARPSGRARRTLQLRDVELVG